MYSNATRTLLWGLQLELCSAGKGKDCQLPFRSQRSPAPIQMRRTPASRKGDEMFRYRGLTPLIVIGSRQIWRCWSLHIAHMIRSWKQSALTQSRFHAFILKMPLPGNTFTPCKNQSAVFCIQTLYLPFKQGSTMENNLLMGHPQDFWLLSFTIPIHTTSHSVAQASSNSRLHG